MQNSENGSQTDQPSWQDELRAALLENKVRVRFTKKDGSVRIMVCTLRPDLIIPYEKKTEQTRSVTPNPDMMTVWDVEAEGFRKITLSTIQSWNISNDIRS